MGAFLKEDDIYVTSLLELLNVRFGRRFGTSEDGIDELKDLQREFGIFKPGRSLSQSLRVLNVGGSWNPDVKSRWFKYLDSLDRVDSDEPGVYGGPAVVDRLADNLESKNPLPVYFEPHNSRDNGNRVLMTVGRPLFFMLEDHLVVSLPMSRRNVPKGSKGSKGGKKKSKGR
jgi:hypothetical protein